MGQIRLFASSAAPAIQQASRILGLELEEDGIPVSAFEEDEATGLWNLSIYCQPDEADRIRDRMAQVLADHGIAEAIGEEALAVLDRGDFFGESSTESLHGNWGGSHPASGAIGLFFLGFFEERAGMDNRRHRHLLRAA